jgi:regulator of sigma E protease
MILAIFSFLLVVTIMVFIHEWGHFAVARFFKVKVETFAIGFGKSLWSRQDKKGTIWTINLLPLGGYVKLFGDAGPASESDLEKINSLSDEEKSQTFFHKKLWQKALIVLAGPLMNYFLAFIVAFFLLAFYGEMSLSTTISQIAENSPAAKAGLQIKDEIIKVNNQKVTNLFELKKILLDNRKDTILLTYKRAGEEKEILMTPEDNKIGVMAEEIRLNYNFIESFEKAVLKVYYLNKMIFEGIILLISGEGSKDDLGGPIKIAHITGEAFQAGLEVFLQLLVLLSVNLALVNLLPIPGLDGGHLFYYFIQAISGKPISLKFQNLGIKIGFLLLISLLIFVTINDLLFYVKQ